MTHRTSDSRALKPASSAAADAYKKSSAKINLAHSRLKDRARYTVYANYRTQGKYTLAAGKITTAVHGFIAEAFYSATRNKTVLTFRHIDTLAASITF